MRVVGLEETVENTDVGICHIPVMCGIQRNSSSLHIPFYPWMVGQIVSVINTSFIWFSKRTRAVTEVRELVHVEPNSRKLYFFVKIVEHVHPVVSGVRMEEVDKGCCPWPNRAGELLAGGGFDEDIPLLSFNVWVKLIPRFNTGIDDRHIVIIFQYLLHPIQRESLFINRKVLKIIHVIDVTPNRVQWQVILFEFGQDSL